VQEKQRYEIFNFKDPEGIIRFNELTSSDTLSSCMGDSDARQSGKKWLKIFRNILHRSFKKVRITNKQFKKDNIHNLMKSKTQLLEKINDMRTDILNIINPIKYITR
jgi:hypothetical protein